MQKRTTLLVIASAMALQVFGQYNTPAATLEKHVYTLASDSLLGRGFGTEQGAIAAQYIASQFEEAGIEPLYGNYFHPFNHREGILNIPGINVLGVIPGSDADLAGEYIVLGAHFDHLGWKTRDGDTVVYNGADDNASGTAAIIEIGRNLAANKASPGRSVIIAAFDGEESGLIGSTYFLEKSIIPPHKIKLMFSLDMVGMYEANGGLDMVGVKTLKNYQQIIEELAGEYGITVKKANSTVEQRTDTAPFGNIGIPAIHTFTGLKSPYHKPEDVAQELDYEGMALVANFISATTFQLSFEENISDLPGPKEGQISASGTRVFRKGLRLNVGSSYHNYRGEFFQGKSILATEVGIFANIQATKVLMVQPELLYETKGGQHVDGVFRTHTFTVPLNLLIATPDEGLVRAWLQLGGYYSYHFGGRINDQKIDFDNTYNKQELGITYGVGIEAMNVQMGLYIQRGLTNLVQDQNPQNIEFDMTHQTLYFMLGFMF